MVLGDEAFGRYLDHEIIDLIKQTSQSFPSAMQEYKKSATQKRREWRDSIGKVRQKMMKAMGARLRSWILF